MSLIGVALDAEFEAIRTRPPSEETCPHLWLAATSVRVREIGRPVSMAALVGTNVVMSR